MKLGRIAEFDERSRDYSIRAALGDRPIVSKFWDSYTYLDQGQLSACVGFSWSQQIAADPNPVSHINNESAIAVYRLAQTLDEFPGESYEGTSVLAGVKAVQRIYPEIAESYHWAFGLEAVLLAIGYVGPVVLGIPWYSGMYQVTGEYVEPTGANVGGHAILAVGVKLEEECVTLKNSWGSEWGWFGSCKIKFNDLRKLLKEDGDACVPTGKMNFSAL